MGATVGSNNDSIGQLQHYRDFTDSSGNPWLLVQFCGKMRTAWSLRENKVWETEPMAIDILHIVSLPRHPWTKILLISEAKSWQLQKKRQVQNYQFMVVQGATGCLWHAYTATHLTSHPLYKGDWSHHQCCKPLVHNDFSLAQLWFLNSSPVYPTAATVFSTPLKLDGAGMLCTQDSKRFNPGK